MKEFQSSVLGRRILAIGERPKYLMHVFLVVLNFQLPYLLTPIYVAGGEGICVNTKVCTYITYCIKECAQRQTGKGNIDYIYGRSGSGSRGGGWVPRRSNPDWATPAST